MSFANKGMAIIRRLSVFYLLAAASVLFFGYYYYRYIPANEAELNNRGFRILNQLSDNIVRKQYAMHDVLGNIENSPFYESKFCDNAQESAIKKTMDSAGKAASIEQAGIKLVAEIDSNWAKSDANDSFLVNHNVRGWNFIFSVKKNNGLGRSYGIASVNEDIGPVLQARDDLFDTFMLLYDGSYEAPQGSGKTTGELHDLDIIFKQDNITSATRLNTDSAFRRVINTDHASMANVKISGEEFQAFFRPLTICNKHFVLAGLCYKNDSYDKKIRLVAMRHAAVMVIILLVIFITLPFIKVFLVSAKEPVSKWDVTATCLAAYLGCAALVLIFFYAMVQWAGSAWLNRELERTTKVLDTAITNSFEDARKQLKYYDSLYSTLDNASKDVLGYNLVNAARVAAVDLAFVPRIFPYTTRLMWIDSSGQTIAKWTPLKKTTPRTNVAGYNFFKYLEDYPDGIDRRTVIVDAGKSNVTNEFQVYMSMPSFDTIRIRVPNSPGVCDTGMNVQAKGIAIASFLTINPYPLLPPGFGYCLFDNTTGDVLLHSDHRRNLAENIKAETMDNTALLDCIRLKRTANIDNVQLYGEQCTVRVSPVYGQPFSLMVFSNNAYHLRPLLRIIHFSSETIIYLFIAVLAALLLSTHIGARMSSLPFKISQIEWIRPSGRNKLSYLCTSRYFLSLLCFSVLLVAVIVFSDLDNRSLLYVSWLLPMYALMGFVVSRRLETPLIEEGQPGWKPAIAVIGGFILLFNVIILSLLVNKEYNHSAGNMLVVILFQLVAAGLFRLACNIVFHPELFQKTWTKKCRAAVLGNRQDNFVLQYLMSLFLSVIIMAVLPSVCIVLYAFQAEKVQYFKNKELAIGTVFFEKEKYLKEEVLDRYKTGVRHDLDALDILLSVQYDKLIDTDSLKVTRASTDNTRQVCRLPDEPYTSLLDDLYAVTARGYDSYAIKNKATDSSWYYFARRGHMDTLLLACSSQLSRMQPKSIVLTAVVPGIFSGIFEEGIMSSVFIILFIAFLFYAGYKLLHATMYRIFLLDYFSPGSPLLVNRESSELSEAIEGDGFLVSPAGIPEPMKKQEEHVIAAARDKTDLYENVWKSLSREERYFIFDFADDGYCNYKDTQTLVGLINKGLLKYEKNELRMASLPLRYYILTKRNSGEIKKLKKQFYLPGVWETVRIPVLVVAAMAAVFLLLTQHEISYRLSAILTSVGAIIPLILKVTERFRNGE